MHFWLWAQIISDMYVNINFEDKDNLMYIQHETVFLFSAYKNVLGKTCKQHILFEILFVFTVEVLTQTLLKNSTYGRS